MAVGPSNVFAFKFWPTSSVLSLKPARTWRQTCSMPYFPNASLYYVGLSDAGPNDKNNEPSLSLSLCLSICLSFPEGE